jgi:hypothetical protein
MHPTPASLCRLISSPHPHLSLPEHQEPPLALDQRRRSETLNSICGEEEENADDLNPLWPPFRHTRPPLCNTNLTLPLSLTQGRWNGAHQSPQWSDSSPTCRSASQKKSHHCRTSPRSPSLAASPQHLSFARESPQVSHHYRLAALGFWPSFLVARRRRRLSAIDVHLIRRPTPPDTVSAFLAVDGLTPPVNPF